ncbi:MAG: hypothetical protein QXX95_07015 [Nitrososphaerales archaeon]
MEIKERKLRVQDRILELKVLSLQNSNIILIYENEKDRLGSLTIALMGNTTSIFPARYGENFSKILAQLISEELKTITLASVYLSSELSNEDYRLIIKEVRDILKKSS